MFDEGSLLKRLRVLDLDALAEVYDTYNAALFRYAYRLLGDAPLAEDCVTETFSRLLNALKHGAGPTQFLRAYLYRTAHNWLTDRLREAASGPESLDGLIEADASNEPASTESPLAQQLISDYEASHVRRALSALTDEQRLVITMKFFEDLTNEEIAAALSKPIGAVKSLQHRALGALRRALQNIIEVAHE
jgi:RNA polymerase sigma-70 factor (ECF subfamily)